MDDAMRRYQHLMGFTATTDTLRLRRCDDHAVFERYRRTHDPADKELLVERFRALALHLSRRYHSRGEREDLGQIACLALLKAIERYDPSKGVAFSSFAVPTIIGELRRYFRDCGWSVRARGCGRTPAARSKQQASKEQRPSIAKLRGETVEHRALVVVDARPWSPT
jgi:DNA-directed RNA polymerase specialized sigma subunit